MQNPVKALAFEAPSPHRPAIVPTIDETSPLLIAAALRPSKGAPGRYKMTFGFTAKHPETGETVQLPAAEFRWEAN